MPRLAHTHARKYKPRKCQLRKYEPRRYKLRKHKPRRHNLRKHDLGKYELMNRASFLSTPTVTPSSLILLTSIILDIARAVSNCGAGFEDLDDARAGLCESL